jgi:serine/threonine protein kinase
MNIPGYQLGREISSGEYCSVYNALEIETSKTVTVKFFHPQLSKNPEFCLHLKRTSQRLLNKSIGNIIPVKVAETSPEGCYLVTGYFPCTKCNQPLSTEFTVEEILNFGLQIADSLTRLHAMGMVHGAVSTFNLIFPDSSQVILGLMSFQRTLKQGTSVPAIPLSIDEASYIAPEFSAGKALDARSDFYSLGVVLYELLFKTRPFIADSLQKLLFKKVKMVFPEPDLDLKNLDPLFNKLLAPNPAKRIYNVKDYVKVVEQCGYKINNANSYLKSPSPAVAQKSKVEKPAAKTNNKKLIFYFSAGFLILVILSFFIIDNQSTDKKTASTDQPLAGAIETLDTQKTEVIEAISQADNIAVEPPAEKKNLANELYLKSQQQILQKDFSGALKSINNALKEQHDHSEALKLKKEIELEIKVRTNLIRAEKLIQQGKLILPKNDNAFEIYKNLESQLPVGDNRAREGLENIAGQYYLQANELVLKKQYANAKKVISAGLTVIPEYKKLKQLDLYIRQEQAKQLAAEQEQKQQAALNRQKAAQEKLWQQLAQEKLQKKLIEESKQAALEREKVLEIQRQKEREEELLLQQKQQKIESLFNSARALLEPNQLSVQSLSNSLKIHQELKKLSGNDFTVDKLFRQIVDSYGVLATKQKNIPDLTAALQTVDQGLKLDENNLNLLRLKSEIDQLVSQAEEKQNEVPFVGTF